MVSASVLPESWSRLSLLELAIKIRERDLNLWAQAWFNRGMFPNEYDIATAHLTISDNLVIAQGGEQLTPAETDSALDKVVW